MRQWLTHIQRVPLADGSAIQVRLGQSLLAYWIQLGINFSLCDIHQKQCTHRNLCHTIAATALILTYIYCCFQSIR